MKRIPRTPPLIGILSLALALGLTSAATTAQQVPLAPASKSATDLRHPARPSPEEQTSRMQQALKLNDRQTSEVAAINQHFAESTQALRGKNREQRRPEMVKLIEQRNAEMKAILSKEQYAKYQQHQREARERLRQTRRPQPSPG